MASSTSSTLPGFTAGETVIMAAAYYHATTAEVSTSMKIFNLSHLHDQVDWDKVMYHVNSKSTGACKERIRLCKKKAVDEQLWSAGGSAPRGPAGGVDKHSPSKVNSGPKKDTKPKKTKKADAKIKKEVATAADDTSHGENEV